MDKTTLTVTLLEEQTSRGTSVNGYVSEGKEVRQVLHYGGTLASFRDLCDGDYIRALEKTFRDNKIVVTMSIYPELAAHLAKRAA